MARYLTPRRIGLLALTALYLDGHAAESSRLSILNFLASHIHLTTDYEHLEIAKLFDNLEEDLPAFFEPLRNLASGVPGRNMYDILLGYLYGLNGLDSLHDFFEMFNGRLYPVTSAAEPSPAGLSRSSPLGQYIRRCHVEFTRLQFADLQTLWSTFSSYRAPTWDYWASKNPEDASRLVKEGLNPSPSQYAVSSSEPGVSFLTRDISSDDADNLLTFSIHHLQKLGTRVPSSVRSTLQQWIGNQSGDSGVQSLQHFLAFFEHWRSGQYTMALESLHRYFDYSLAAKGTASDGNMKVYYQYALLHLSVLHADFECWDQSVEAMEECIATGTLPCL